MAVLSLSQPAAFRIYQRDTTTGGLGKGVGTVPLTVTAASSVALVEYQLRDAQVPSSVLVSWASGATNVPAGSQTLTLSVPARAGWYLIDLRANGDNASIVSTTSAIGVGEIIAAAGQSLVTDFWSTTNSDKATISSFGIAVSPFCSVLAAWDGGTLPSATTSWAPPSDSGQYPSTFAAEFLRLVVNATGVNAALVGSSHSGTDISTYWLPGQSDFVRLTNVLNSAGGKFGTFIWCQGHSDADARSGAAYHLTPATTYLGYLRTVLASISASYTAIPFRRILCSIPAVEPGAAAKFSPSGIEAIRGAHQQYVLSDPLASLVDGLDVPVMTTSSGQPDGVHPTQAGNIVFARHFFRQFMRAFRAGTAGDNGPAFTGAAFRPYGSRTIVLPIRHVGGSALVGIGDPRTQFQVFLSGQLDSPLAIASVDLSQPASITLTLAETPANGDALDVWYRRPFDATGVLANGIYDNNASDGDGLTIGRQLALLPTPLVVPVPAVAWHRPILVRPGTPMLTQPGSVAFAG